MNKTVAIVAINETEHMSDELKEKSGGAIYTLYLYDPEEATYCAEITPSFYLIPFDYYTKERLSDEDDSEYGADILGEPIYMHCRSVESIDDKFKATTIIEMDEDDAFDDAALSALKADTVHPEHALTL